MMPSQNLPIVTSRSVVATPISDGISPIKEFVFGMDAWVSVIVMTRNARTTIHKIASYLDLNIRGVATKIIRMG